MKRWGVITIAISTLLLWGWLSTPVIGVANTTDSPATIRFDGKTESSTKHVDGDRLHATEASKTSHSGTSGSTDNQPARIGWLPQTSEQWWLSAFIGGIGLLVILIVCQLINYLKKRSSLS